MSLSASLRPQAAPHLHIAGEICPWCEQPIPHDKFDEIKERIEARERERSAEITARLREQFAHEQSEADAKAKAEIDRVRQEAAAALERGRQNAAATAAAAREEGRLAAEAAAEQTLADAALANQEAQTALRGELEQVRAAQLAAEEAGDGLKAQLEQLRRETSSAIENVKQEAAARADAVRKEAATAAEASMQAKLAESEQAKTDAEAKVLVAEQQIATLNENFETQLNQRLQDQREILERAQTDAVNAEKSAAFEEKMKLSGKVEELQRALDKKTAEELGEGAEIDLYEVLKAEFDGDRIERINKGLPGADIIHVVMHNGKECSKIIYNSKNHNAWRNEFVTKLASDQMAARAEHAIFSVRKFPAGHRHLHVQDGVILASPARVAALVQVIRRHIVQVHTLRLSNEERTQKTAALYSFIISERCTELLARFDTHADDLLDLQVKEKRAHELTWRRQGELIRSVQKVRAELCREIDAIIGTAEDPVPAP